MQEPGSFEQQKAQRNKSKHAKEQRGEERTSNGITICLLFLVVLFHGEFWAAFRLPITLWGLMWVNVDQKKDRLAFSDFWLSARLLMV